MNEKEELQKREALIEYNKAKDLVRNEQKKKLKIVLIWIVILIILGVLIRIVFGKIYIPVFGFNESVEYNLYINDRWESLEFEDISDRVIIPGLVYLRKGNYGVWSNPQKEGINVIVSDDKVVLDFSVNACYTKDKIRVNCDSYNDKLLREKVEPEFTKLFIKKWVGRKDKVLYDGKFVNDISDYVSETGHYFIQVDASYKNVSTKLYIILDKINDVKDN